MSAANEAKPNAAGLLSGALVLAVLAIAPPAGAMSNGPPWEVAGAKGCPACHFDPPPITDSPSLSIDGLPERVEPGRRYRLTVRLVAPEMLRAGFMISSWRERAEAGRFMASGAGIETQGAKARATREGGAVGESDVAEWSLDWRAPAESGGPLVFELWSVASDDDRSPLGDQVHKLTKEVTAAPR